MKEYKLRAHRSFGLFLPFVPPFLLTLLFFIISYFLFGGAEIAQAHVHKCGEGTEGEGERET